MTSRGTFRTLLAKPVVAGIAGGLVVALVGLLSIRAGWLDVEEGSAAAPAPAPPAAGAALRPGSAGEIYERSGESVAFIEAGQGSSGSGFLMDSGGHVLTNAHVVEGSDSVTVRLGEEGEPLDAEVLGLDTSTDVAVLQVDADAAEVEPLTLGDSGEIAVGDAVVAIGNPFGLDRTVTTGIVSALQRQISAPDGFTISDVIQTDAAINPGNSGGPLFNAAGEVIGINSQIATAGGGGSDGVGFAVPVNTVKTVAEQILDDGTADHAFIGISGADLTPEIADALNLDAESGALVQEVTPNGPAENAGLEAGGTVVGIDGADVAADGDLIVAADGREVTGMDDLIAVINAKQPGDEVELEVERDGETRTVTVELGERPTEEEQRTG
jgi:S1-C subfamily serine protease